MQQQSDHSLEKNSNTSSDLSRVLGGLSNPPEAQQASGKPGDPQEAALEEYLITKHFDENDIVVDFGCGKGILARILDKLTDQDLVLPHYLAVDKSDEIDKLSLPARIHNVSKKLTIEQFLDTELPQNKRNIKLVVIRNVFHELKIRETARLVALLNEHLEKTAEVYIQDMEILRGPERANAGWDPHIFKEIFTILGIKSRLVPRKSHSGTPWFTIILNPNTNQIDLDKAVQICAQARKRQLRQIATKLKGVVHGEYGEDTLPEYLSLTNEYAGIGLQLQDVKPSYLPQPLQFSALKDLNSPLRYPLGDFDFAERVSDEVTKKSGLIAILSRKGIIDFPKMIANCKEFTYFLGYSLHSLFGTEEDRETLHLMVKSGKRLYVLVTDPDSDTARIRAHEPIYGNHHKLLEDIHETIEAGRKFYQMLCMTIGEEKAKKHFQIKVTKRVPTSSNIIIDDLCFVSLYGRILTGTSAPCLVFRKTPGVIYNYYEIVLKEFEDAFAEATSVMEGGEL
ncbi:MAG: class I SAM-dependent methyltransferase [Methanophagales archaeon]|nr:class I SAM-dependent methyltransferase [Methanophagales archaeon]